MDSELAVIIINPYTIAKSRTGGVIGRFLSRTGLELVAARMFAPSRKLVDEYSEIVRTLSTEKPGIRQLLADYVRDAYAPDPATGLPRRVMMILLEGEEAIRKVNETTGPVMMGGGETIRDTFGDYVVDNNKRVQYFEPAVLVGGNREETKATLKIWSRYSSADGGLLKAAVDARQTDAGWQRTLVLIKPDNFVFPTARPGNIIDVLSRSGLRIVAAKVHRMSVAQAEEFYKPVRAALCEKMKTVAAEKAIKLLETEFNIVVPAALKKVLEDQIGPLLGAEQFNQLIKFMTGCYPPACPPKERDQMGRSKCLALVYAGLDAVQKIRMLLGPTDPSKAQPGSVRREFGQDIMVNAAHASDSAENAEREMRIIQIEEDLITAWVRKYYGE